MPQTTTVESGPQEWLTFVEAVRYVAAATKHQFDDDPADDILRGVEEIREALILDKIPIEWVDAKYGEGFNRYILYAIDNPPDHVGWEIGYIAGEVTIPNPRPTYLDRSYVTELRRLRKLRLLKAVVLGLWPDGPTVDLGSFKDEQLRSRVREEARRIYKTSRPNMAVAEQQVRSATGVTRRKLIRDVLQEAEFVQRRLPPGNSRKSKT
jgi:hypothetical protein